VSSVLCCYYYFENKISQQQSATADWLRRLTIVLKMEAFNGSDDAAMKAVTPFNLGYNMFV